MMRLNEFLDRRRIGTLLVLCQFLLIGWLGFQGGPTLMHGNVPTGTWIMGAMGLVLGVLSLLANRPGNFNITPNPRPHGHLVTLGNWRGSLVCNDFSGYKASFALGVTEAGCLAHARRKFVDLQATGKSLIAETAVRFFTQLSRVRQLIAVPPPRAQ